MTNAKKELLEILKCNVSQIKCANISHELGWEDSEDKKFKLTLNHTKLDLENFLESLNFTYDSGYGSQKLFGIIWLKDGTWLSRKEYDGNEWWLHNVLPEIPKELL